MDSTALIHSGRVPVGVSLDTNSSLMQMASSSTAVPPISLIIRFPNLKAVKVLSVQPVLSFTFADLKLLPSLPALAAIHASK